MLKEDIRFQESTVFEGMPSISALISAMKNQIHDRKIQKILFDRDKTKSKAPELRFLRANAEVFGFDLELTDGDTISQYTVGSSHGGVIAFCSDRSFQKVEEATIKQNGVYFMLEGVEDPYNFGNSIRSLYASGVDGIILTPRNWMSAAGVVCRSSAGASELLPVYLADSATDAISTLRDKGYQIVCAGIRNSVSLFETSLQPPLFVIVGGERRGISSSVLNLADTVVRIDYGCDFHGSLSTSASASVFAFEILRQKHFEKN